MCLCVILLNSRSYYLELGWFCSPLSSSHQDRHICLCVRLCKFYHIFQGVLLVLWSPLSSSHQDKHTCLCVRLCRFSVIFFRIWLVLFTSFIQPSGQLYVSWAATRPTVRTSRESIMSEKSKYQRGSCLKRGKTGHHLIKNKRVAS